jgi:hypothetical protein
MAGGAGAELALWFTDVHAAWFPDGSLVPEREVLATHALELLGRAADARARARGALERRGIAGGPAGALLKDLVQRTH